MTPSNAIKFKRGSTFSFNLLVPTDIADGYFRDWEIFSQIRKHRDDTPSGLIASLGLRWQNSTTTRRLMIFDAMTDKWPLGPADMDVVFASATGYRIRSKTVSFIIERGITR